MNDHLISCHFIYSSMFLIDNFEENTIYIYIDSYYINEEYPMKKDYLFFVACIRFFKCDFTFFSENCIMARLSYRLYVYNNLKSKYK